MAEMVVVDTCVWAAFFRRGQNGLKDQVTQLLKRDSACLVGPVIAEVLLGIRNERHADWVWSVLDGLHNLALEAADWRTAAALGRQIAVHQRRLPLSDLVIAAASIRYGCKVLTIDPDFDHIPNVQLLKPATLQ